ncbi:MAG TPA: hypothetical protein VK874_07040, partial [Gaiellaceae bacterium]|nr:hypothetical protein [Gaiellaceae bacterium]
KRRENPGPCATRGCDAPRRRYSSGLYGPLCWEHKLEHDRRRLGWDDEGGMATTPIKLKEI